MPYVPQHVHVANVQPPQAHQDAIFHYPKLETSCQWQMFPHLRRSRLFIELQCHHSRLEEVSLFCSRANPANIGTERFRQFQGTAAIKVGSVQAHFCRVLVGAPEVKTWSCVFTYLWSHLSFIPVSALLPGVLQSLCTSNSPNCIPLTLRRGPCKMGEEG